VNDKQQLEEAQAISGCALLLYGCAANGRIVFSTKPAPEDKRHRAALRLREAGYVFGTHRLANGAICRGWNKRRRRASNLRSLREKKFSSRIPK
jgi:hypothetical protein